MLVFYKHFSFRKLILTHMRYPFNFFMNIFLSSSFCSTVKVAMVCSGSVVEPDPVEVICLGGAGSRSENNIGSGSNLIVKIILFPFLELTLHNKLIVTLLNCLILTAIHFVQDEFLEKYRDFLETEKKEKLS